MYAYRAYGLGIHSELPLPELTPLAEARFDVVIRIGKINWSPDKKVSALFDSTGNCAWLSWPEVGKFVVSRGKEIIMDPSPGAEERLIRLPLLGAVLGVLLHQRGLLVLHASAAEVNGVAIAFIGQKGTGKSTTAAMLYARGHKLLADDVVAIDLESRPGPRVLPGFPQIKLWPDAAAALLPGEDTELLPELAAGLDKRSRQVADRFSGEPATMNCICALAEGPLPEVKLLSPQESMLQVIGHSYVVRFGGDLLKGREATQHLQACAELVKRVPVFRLERPNSLQLLSAIASLVEQQSKRDNPLSQQSQNIKRAC